MKPLRDTSWKISYSSNTHNTIADFYIPALESAIQYDRKSGFFSSAIFNTQYSTGNSEATWCVVPKEEIKRKFRQDEIKILLCTESASEGLNLQNCGVLINYDMPWNPMRVEQRIGRTHLYFRQKIENVGVDIRF